MEVRNVEMFLKIFVDIVEIHVIPDLSQCTFYRKKRFITGCETKTEASV